MPMMWSQSNLLVYGINIRGEWFKQAIENINAHKSDNILKWGPFLSVNESNKLGYHFNLFFLLQKLYLKGTTVNIYYDKHFYIKQWNTKERKVLQARSWNNFPKLNNTVLESLRIGGTDIGTL